MASVAPVPESERNPAPLDVDGTQERPKTEEPRLRSDSPLPDSPLPDSPLPDSLGQRRSRRGSSRSDGSRRGSSRSDGSRPDDSWWQRFRKSRAHTVIRTVLFLAFAIGMWPMRLGGFSNFIVVRGASMEPHFHSGDMLYVWSSDSFKVGDIAVYRIPKGQAGASNLVIHRIIGTTEEGKYLFQGDNRESRDEGEIPRGDLVGRPVANLGPLPTRGVLLAPLLLSAVIGAAVTFMLWPRVPEPSPDALPEEANAAAEDDEQDEQDEQDGQDRQARVGKPRPLIVMEWLPELEIPEAEMSSEPDQIQASSPPPAG